MDNEARSNLLSYLLVGACILHLFHCVLQLCFHYLLTLSYCAVNQFLYILLLAEGISYYLSTSPPPLHFNCLGIYNTLFNWLLFSVFFFRFFPIPSLLLHITNCLCHFRTSPLLILCLPFIDLLVLRVKFVFLHTLTLFGLLMKKSILSPSERNSSSI